MRRHALAAATVVLAVGATGLAPAPDAGARRRAAPARLLVEAREFSLVLSRPSLAAGSAIVQLAVRGEDGHDLRFVRVDARGRSKGAERAIPETRPGETADWRGTLRRGRFRLSCSLPGHAAAGMRATLRVR
jgi:hypothetical protein